MMKQIFSAIAVALLITACSKTTEVAYADFPTAAHLNPKVEGFEVQSIKEGSGEWLSIAMDAQGRLLVSPRNGSLLRFTMPANDSKNLKIDTLDIGVNDCQGLLYAYGHLYMMGTNKDTIRGIHRVPDLDGEGNYGKPTLMKEIPKNGDHSGHTLTVGKDGYIYFLSGNENRPPKGSEVEYVYEDWRNDHLMPLKSIFGVSQVPPGGYVVRTDSVGSKWELVSYGLRNPYDMCFSPEGELFTFDSDMEWDFNLPWYRPTRVNHLVSGGDYAWRQSTAKRFDYYPDILPCVVEFGRGSPTATLFGTGTAFPAKYQQALFLGDWSYGKIYAMFLEPDGATFKAEYETFITGQPLNITDMVVGQDGALYFVTGGNGTDTGLFRVTYNGDQSTKQIETQSELHPNLLLRRKLEQYHFAQDTSGLALALRHIGHEDRFVKNAAKTILERNNPSLWKATLVSTDKLSEQITLITALIRSDATNQYQELIFDQLQQFNFGSLSEADQLALLRLHALAFVRSKTIPTSRVPSVYNNLIQYYPASSKVLNKELSRVLGYLALQQGEGSVMLNKTFELLESTDDPVQFVHYLEMMRLVPNGWTLEQRGAYKYWLNYARDNMVGGSLFKYFLNEIESEFDSTLKQKEKKWLTNNKLKPLNEDYKGPVPPKPKASANIFEQTRPFTAWKMEDLQYGLELVSSPRDRRLRDFNRGQLMFAKGQCYDCHYMINKGGGFGPELTLAGNSFSAEDLLTAILHPSKDINSRFQSTVFEMKDGSTLAGRLMTEDSDRYVIQASYDPASTQEVEKRQVASQMEAPYSDMPTGLINTMSREEIMDLLYFIIQVAGKDKDTFDVAIFEDKTIFEVGDSALVEMINFSDRGQIYYTIDGSEPTAEHQRYQAPFFVKESALIKAKVIDGDESSDTQERMLHAVDRNKNGLDWKLYLNVPERFEVSSSKTPDASGVAYNFDVRPIAEGENSFELHYEGYLQIEEADTYIFYTQEDDALKLYIDNQLVIDDSGGNWMSDSKGKIQLNKGLHKIKVQFYDRLSFEYLSIEYEGSTKSRRPIEGSQLFREQGSL